MIDDIPHKLYKFNEVAAYLRVDPKTLRRYVADEMFENLVVIQRAERRRVLFTDESLASFMQCYGQSMKTEERPKRTYNRRVVKGRRKKKTNGRKAA